jgi:hypothetical protein
MRLRTLGIIFITFCLMTTVGIFAQENPVLTAGEMQNLDPGRNVSLVKILDDGRLLLVSENPSGQDVRLIFTSSGGKLRRHVDVPIGGVEYITTNSDGEKIVIFSKERFSFYSYDSWRRKWKLFMSRQEAGAGFALFGGRKSMMFFDGDSVLAWGYFYDRSGDYTGECLVRIYPGGKSGDLVGRIADISMLLEEAKKLFPGGEKIEFLRVDKRQVIFTCIRGRSGIILGYDLEKKEMFRIDEFSSFSGGDLSQDGTKFAYSIVPAMSESPGVVFIYDLQKRLPVKIIPGKFFNPVLDARGQRVAMGSTIEVSGKSLACQISVASISGERADITTGILVKGQPLVWRFTGQDRLTVLAGRGDIYQLRIK